MRCEVGDVWCSGNCLWCRGMRREQQATRFALFVACAIAAGLVALVVLARCT